jgi:hypothetical protein
MGRKPEARARFEMALKRQPKRRASLDGLAKSL